MLDVKSLGANIKKRRLQLGLSQAQLAMGLTTQGTISNLENGTHTPSIELLVDLAERLRTTLDQLIKTTSQLDSDTAFGIHTLAEVETLWNERKYTEMLNTVMRAEGTPFFSNVYSSAELNFWRARAFYDLRRVEPAKTCCEEQIARIRDMGETPLLVSYYNLLGCAHILLKDLQRAKDLLERAHWILNRQRFPKAEHLYIRVLSDLTNVHLRLGNLDMAIHLGNNAASYARRLVSRSDTAVIYELLAEAYYRRSDRREVHRHLDFALRVHEIANDRVGQARLLNNLAVVSQEEGNLKAAKKYLAQSHEFIEAEKNIPASRAIEEDVKQAVTELMALSQAEVPEAPK